RPTTRSSRGGSWWPSTASTPAPAAPPATAEMSEHDPKPVRIDLMRRTPAGALRAQWRSLEELTGSDAFRAALERESPRQASEWDDPEGRRNFMKVMGA